VFTPADSDRVSTARKERAFAHPHMGP
jgi:hypothetical protein